VYRFMYHYICKLRTNLLYMCVRCNKSDLWKSINFITCREHVSISDLSSLKSACLSCNVGRASLPQRSISPCLAVIVEFIFSNVTRKASRFEGRQIAYRDMFTTGNKTINSQMLCYLSIFYYVHLKLKVFCGSAFPANLESSVCRIPGVT
jgi:hypothetical protein